ncbi:hypothetical protein XA68_12432 [Ophiocordyceps unilateralis]|uniref:N-acetyltransferase domain-containing protein n=1 Tax=Ophiocordyceps unilateralis TaxID=268505 RepID=A0A2A9PER5_OPHUN|nr:hypothetical protein XA68_12432 [Ophiocordyceps unilateralis]
MSLPSAKAPAAQLSIRSFFPSKTIVASPPLSRVGKQPPPPPPPPPPVSSPAVASPLPTPSVDAPLPSLPTGLPSEAVIRPISETDTAALRRINALLLPVNYPESFYARAVGRAQSGRFSRIVTWAHQGEEPKVVGGLVCRLESDDEVGNGQRLYIQSLCLLAPYRGKGLMTAALDHIIATARSDLALDVRSVTAHVWTDNEDGLRWYQSRGFDRREQPVAGYYLKLRPDSAWLVRRRLPSSGPPKMKTGSPLAKGDTAITNLPASRPPPSRSSASTPALPSTTTTTTTSAQSYQNQRPETEWNDLPADMAPDLLAPPRSDPSSRAGSRSSSAARKKKDRSYPAAAFGS